MYRKYYSYNDMPVPKNVSVEKKEEKEIREVNKPPEQQGGFLQGLESDDLILIAVILALLLDGCEDKLLIGAIAFVLLSGLNGT